MQTSHPFGRHAAAILPALLLLTAALLRPSPAHSDTIKLFYNPRPPYFVEDAGSVTGLTADRTAAVFRAAAVPYIWVKMPAKRHLLSIRSDQDWICAPGWFKNPERQRFARYTRPIYQDEPTVVLTRAEATSVTVHTTVETLLHDPSLIVLVKDGYSYGDFLDNKLEEAAGTLGKMTTTGENLNMALMIAAGRADYMFMSAEEGAALIKAQTFADRGLMLVRLTDMPPGERRYILCSHSVPPDVIERLDQAIIEQIDNGPFAQTPRSY